ncbi:MAG: Fmu (Sun) domain-containing protein [Ferruginibacter sp.]
MSRFHSHLASAVKIIEAYKGEEPFVHAIKKYFSANKKYGSKDRKTISSLCYNYFRAALALKDKTVEEKILLSLFLCEHTSSELLNTFHPELNEQIATSTQAKFALLQLNEDDLFPFAKKLSAEVNAKIFATSFLQQPYLFIRIRPNRKVIVEAKLTAANIAFDHKRHDSLILKNATALDSILTINKDVVIQDDSSQQVLNYLNEHPISGATDTTLTAWDCCAASGGKSILLYDKLNKDVQLTVSDIRENILFNCKKRLSQAGVNIYKSFIADLTKDDSIKEEDQFSIIICDVPCSGSGTWARTPEQLGFFKPAQLDLYVERQKLIVKNAHQHLTKGGFFFYITCSVFTKENENVVEFIKEKTKLELLSAQYIKGFEMKADTMFVAVFKL